MKQLKKWRVQRCNNYKTNLSERTTKKTQIQQYWSFKRHHDVAALHQLRTRPSLRCYFQYDSIRRTPLWRQPSTSYQPIPRPEETTPPQQQPLFYTSLVGPFLSKLLVILNDPLLNLRPLLRRRNL